MKKLLLLFVAVCVSLISFGQAVVENATIPVSINLNAILRLNVVSGGSIEFSFNTLSDYESGISGTRYQTVFTVASSTNFAVNLKAEDANFIGTDDETNVLMTLDFVAHTVTGGIALNNTLSAAQTDLTNADVAIVTSAGTGNAGNISDNEFTIAWECATAATGGGVLLGQNITPDRYTTNVFLTLSRL